MKKKIFIAIFFIMICLPSLGMFFYKTDISAEKREVQTFPKVKETTTEETTTEAPTTTVAPTTTAAKAEKADKKESC